MTEKKKGPVRLLIKFESEEKLAEWFGYAKDECQFSEDSAVFRLDALDKKLLKMDGKVFLVARNTDRPDATRLKIRKVVEEPV